MCKIAVIDLGSNSVRMSIFDAEKKETVFSCRDSVKLSEGMLEDMCISAKAQMRTVTVLKEYKKILDSLKVQKISAVATAAMRKAKNSHDFLALIKDLTGIELKIISGMAEAKLDCLAVRETLGISQGVICDIGGGSTEIIGICDHKELKTQSIPYGSRGICEMFFKDGETSQAKSQAEAFLNEKIFGIDWIKSHQSKTLVGIGGTIRALAKYDMKESDSAPVSKYEIPICRMNQIISEVENACVDERLKMPGIGKDRADIILGGLVILKSALKALTPKTILVADVGVREGVFYDIIKNTGII